MWPFTSSKPPPPSPTPPEGGPKIGKSGKKICCSCPDTKAARDACIRQNGEEDVSCQKLIELHKECLRGEGFSVK
jgi:cytochrome c oxidase assembly protein subunit 17